MKFGVREICDVVLKAKANQIVGNKKFYAGEPVIYFDTLKTSSMEGAATTVYAQGGRGNSRLVAWEGERTITFTMEDALISPAGFMILSGAGLIEGTDTDPLKVHVAEQTAEVYGSTGGNNIRYVQVKKPVSSNKDATIFVMPMKDGEIVTEPYIGKVASASDLTSIDIDDEDLKAAVIAAAGEKKVIAVITQQDDTKVDGDQSYSPTIDPKDFSDGVVMVDYYTEYESGAQQIDITPDKFGGNYYLEASTLFRTTDGVDMPAEFIIPNCKIQSNFTFTMASSGDPSTFTFTMDAFPDYTRFNKTKKVLAAIQIVSETTGDSEINRIATPSGHEDKYFN